MPKLRVLSAKEVIKIFEQFGFNAEYQRGSHVHLQRMVAESKQRIVVPHHGNKDIKKGTLKSIYNTGLEYISEEELKPHFYTD